MATLQRSVAAGADDAEEKTDGTGFSSIDVNIVLSADPDPAISTNVGLRFTKIDIPQGSTIISATITVTNTIDFVDNVKANIYLENVIDASDFVTTPDITDRVRTTASTLWDATSLGTGAKVSPNFSDALQEVVGGAWVSGNALVVLLIGASDVTREFQFLPFEGTGAAAVLDVEYNPPPPPIQSVFGPQVIRMPNRMIASG